VDHCSHPPGGLIDTDRYPVTNLEGAEAQRVIAHARAQLVDRGAAELVGFIPAAGVAALVAEAGQLEPLAHWSEGLGSAYLEPPARDVPDGHPRRWQGRHRLGAVAYDLFSYQSPLRRLYEWDPLRQLIAAMLDRGPIYPYGDPFGALNLAVMGNGDELQWHFDQTDFVVSLALRPAEGGGDFEFAPLIRSDDRQVADVLAGRRDAVQVLPMTPGTLLLFEGRNSLHRVSRVSGPASRLVALFGYDTKPGTVGTDGLHRERYGRTLNRPGDRMPGAAGRTPGPGALRELMTPVSKPAR
jgi:hypothetical protein